MWHVNNDFDLSKFYEVISHQFYIDIIENQDVSKIYNHSYNSNFVCLFPIEFVAWTNGYRRCSVGERFLYSKIHKPGFYKGLLGVGKDFRPLTDKECKKLKLPEVNQEVITKLFDFKTKEGNSINLIYPTEFTNNKFKYVDDKGEELNLNQLDESSQNIINLLLTPIDGNF